MARQSSNYESYRRRRKKIDEIDTQNRPLA